MGLVDQSADPVCQADGLPKDIDVPLTVPTNAWPLVLAVDPEGTATITFEFAVS